LNKGEYCDCCCCCCGIDPPPPPEPILPGDTGAAEATGVVLLLLLFRGDATLLAALVGDAIILLFVGEAIVEEGDETDLAADDGEVILACFSLFCFMRI
jgi:hypothetical protein